MAASPGPAGDLSAIPPAGPAEPMVAVPVGEGAGAPEPKATPKRRGRPPGSKNKPKPPEQQPQQPEQRGK